MDPVKAITDITGHVLIRIGNPILGNGPDGEPSGDIHIHLHIADDDPDEEPKPRGWARLKR
ncbi:hypothetical protein [Rhodococcus spongiicola]|uniref:Uncharacterized protein n=1 Tax=Rhodococcus spongiicola TaxID=2487352 RepID=A0A438ANI6_9NOCA|nr:hypothetical protein [Rhodococcus spongiicola]RVW00428.1 hypothetical protein EF834_17425 [Rhodococcus spongiicola]